MKPAFGLRQRSGAEPPFGLKLCRSPWLHKQCPSTSSGRTGDADRAGFFVGAGLKPAPTGLDLNHRISGRTVSFAQGVWPPSEGCARRYPTERGPFHHSA
jgi:hypothetical protein